MPHHNHHQTPKPNKIYSATIVKDVNNNKNSSSSNKIGYKFDLINWIPTHCPLPPLTNSISEMDLLKSDLYFVGEGKKQGEAWAARLAQVHQASGLAGTIYFPDVVVAAAVGVVTGSCVGSLIPLLFSAILSEYFLDLCGLTDANRIEDSSYEFSVLDSNSLLFLFKYAPEVAKGLHIGQELSFETANMSHRETWLASSSDDLRVEVAVVEQVSDDEAERLKAFSQIGQNKLFFPPTLHNGYRRKNGESLLVRVPRSFPKLDNFSPLKLLGRRQTEEQEISSKAETKTERSRD
ncbi:unnamed protein product [Dovyalis caffra]|uniref:Uncharacterized protein n=1 Tax=Dovyalis caffra TaxID=77055 RepID=A0AAV1R210_9ROSI|nr:unnamed protein product [Dovyalis caffra]